MKMRASMSDGTGEPEVFEIDSAPSSNGRTLAFGTSDPGSSPGGATGPRWIAQCTWENRKQRRMGVANFTPPKAMPKAEAKGLRRKLLKQRQRARVPKLDTKTRRLAAAALAFKSGAVVIPAGEAEVMARLLTAFLQNPPAIADEITRRYPQDLAIQILAELERKANL